MVLLKINNFNHMKSNIIYISEFVGANLNSRLAVRNMRDDIIKENIEYVIIDFSNVVFASRSFMDEFYNVMILNNNFSVEVINLPPEINSLLTIIKSNQHTSRTYKKSNVKSFSTVNEVNNYLNTLSFI